MPTTGLLGLQVPSPRCFCSASIPADSIPVISRLLEVTGWWLWFRGTSASAFWKHLICRRLLEICFHCVHLAVLSGPAPQAQPAPGCIGKKGGWERGGNGWCPCELRKSHTSEPAVDKGDGLVFVVKHQKLKESEICQVWYKWTFSPRGCLEAWEGCFDCCKKDSRS